MRLTISIILLLCTFLTKAQNKFENPKVILITLDGLRWQELFTGADSQLISNKKYVGDTTELKSLYWRTTPDERRKVLMPFVWNSIVKNGQIYGNRDLGSKMNLTNKHWFSYPGYNEILSGKSDDERIDSNSKIPNPNKTILEVVNADSSYKDKVYAFGSWDVFPYIVNEERSGVPVNAGFEEAKGTSLTMNELYLNKLQKVTPSPWSTVRLDVFTHHYALETLKSKQPDLLYIAYGETDDYAHEGHYDAYLKSANRTDGFIKELWDFTQKHPNYKNNTTFIITTDHGRGTEPLKTWKGHGSSIVGADQTWLMIFGEGVSKNGEVSEQSQIFTNQIAATIANIFKVKVENIGEAFDFVEYK